MIIFLAKNTKIAPKVKGQAEMSPKSNHIIEFAIRRIHVKLCRFLIRSFLSLLRWKKWHADRPTDRSTTMAASVSLDDAQIKEKYHL